MWFTLVWHWVKCWETIDSLSEVFLLMLLKFFSLVMHFCDITHQRLCETVCSQKRKKERKRNISNGMFWRVLKGRWLICLLKITQLYRHIYLLNISIWLYGCEVHLRAQLNPAYLTSLLRCACCWLFLAVLCPELWSCFWLVIDIKEIECVIQPDVTCVVYWMLKYSN